jgi:hypothetical protein
VSTPETHGIRIGHDEREAAVRELGEHFSEGRLAPQEYEERMSAAYAARTTDDLAPLFADLPRAQDAATTLVAQAPATHWPVAPTAVVAAGPDAPHGLDPVTGRAYSDRSKVAAGLLQLFLPFGVGRFYSGHTGVGVMQLLLAPFGVGMVWAFIDGIVMLTGEPIDPRGRPLRP